MSSFDEGGPPADTEPRSQRSAHPALRPDRIEAAPVASAARTGRRVALFVYYAVVVAICVAGAVQVTQQVIFVPSENSPYADCHAGLSALFAAVERARTAAADTDGE